MKKQLPLLFAFALIFSGIAFASADLADYPKQFFSSSESFNGQLIVGNTGPATDVIATQEISETLQQKSSTVILAGTEDEFDQNRSAILVGLPCQNKAVAIVLGVDSCDFGLSDGQGYLKIIERNGAAQVIVSGKSAADIRKAARVLAKYKEYALRGSEMIVTGTLESPQISNPVEQIKPVQKAECMDDTGCPNDKWCNTGKCYDLGCPEGTIAKNHDCFELPKEAVTPPVSQPENALTRASDYTAKDESEKVAQVASRSSGSQGILSKIISFFKSIFR